MPNLVLQVREGDFMLINGAIIEFHKNTKIALQSRARFMLGKQVMHADEVTSQARKLYFSIQRAYTGDDEDRIVGLMETLALIAELKEASSNAWWRDSLDHVLAFVESGAFYPALKLAAKIVRHDDVERAERC